MSFYDDMAGVALELIAEFGQSVILREVIPGDYDSETGQTAPDQTREQVAHGIMADFTGFEFQNNSLIKQGDQKLKLAAKGLEWAPSLMSKVVVQGVTWAIVPPLKEINPAGTPLLYELQVRL
ncbi:hypothetical protein GYM96_02785 [Pseudomonas fragi]|uniref:hypothetical protein n=1 Tax=Pseudomonas fragi TaxID=296 RepID=UPI00193C70CD|nr:hypothetical protein [Pseudomonas fragi]MBM1198703.1 hypothetical protein [Pseudomonas fragi]